PKDSAADSVVDSAKDMWTLYRPILEGGHASTPATRTWPKVTAMSRRGRKALPKRVPSPGLSGPSPARSAGPAPACELLLRNFRYGYRAERSSGTAGLR